MLQIELYQSVLKNLSILPADYLQQVNNYLLSLSQNIEKKRENRKAVLALAGSWDDMSKEDFNDYLRIAKETGKKLFNREIEL
jgi:conjugal transfer/entry exclusion protein